MGRASASEAETGAATAASADAFVGRRQLIDELAGSPPHGPARVVDTLGIAGMGKTRLVAQLHAEAAAWQDVVDFSVSFDEASCPTTLSQAFDSFVQMVASLGQHLFATSGRLSLSGGFANELSRAAQSRTRELVRVDADVTVDARRAKFGKDADVGVVDVDVDTRGIEGVLLGDRFRDVVSAFGSRYKRVVKRKPALVTVDGFDTIAGSAFSKYVLSLLAQLPNTLVVIVRSPGSPAPGLAGVTPERKQLEPFSRDEVGELLAGLPGHPLDPGLVDIIYTWSEGHAFTAALAAKYLRTLDEPDPEEFARRLAELPEEYVAQRVAMALELVRAPGVGDLAETAGALAVARRFDADLLDTLAGDEAQPLPAAEVIERLRAAGLVEPAGPGWYRVHSFVREPLEERLAPARRRLFHRRVADHHYAVLMAEEPELDTTARAYEDWYRYEKPQWQAELREWLYHNRHAATTDEERERARLQFLRVFLDAFWWWGCYVPFPFCRDLIADWNRIRDDDDEWVGELTLLLDAYPTGHRKQGKGNWSEVRSALVGVRSSCGLDVDADQLQDEDARHTRGLLDNFLAHSLRYRTTSSDAERTRSYEQALNYYEEAARLFEADDETWEFAWTLFETAELHADYGELERARDGWRRAVDVGLDEDDWELKANLHRLVADIRWQEGSRATAFDAHGRAVLHAYLFQCKTPSRRPDAYTVTFYREQLERVYERLREIDSAALEDAVSRLAAPFGVEAAGVEPVAAALAAEEPWRLAGLVFPEAPADDELKEVRSGFTRGVQILAEDLGGAPARDLAEVEP